MNHRHRCGTLLLLGGGLVLTVGPLIWMLITAFCDSDALARLLGRLSGGNQAWPSAGELFTCEQFRLILGNPRIGWWVGNSFVVAGVITVGQLLVNALAAFSFAVGRYRGREALFWLVLATIMVPGQIVMLPLFLLMAKLGLLDSLWAVILPSLAAPYGIYLVRQYMDSIPRELLEAARMDGASEWAIFWRIYAPLSAPVLATSGIFVFIAQWNSFLWPLVVLNADHRYTLTVGLATMQEQQAMDYGLLMAGATVAALPMVAVFLFFSRYLLSDTRAGAVKG